MEQSEPVIMGFASEEPGEILNHTHAIAIIRPPIRVSDEGIEKLCKSLLNRGIIPMLLAKAADEGDFQNTYRFFPTDYFRQVGETIVTTNSAEIDVVLQTLKADEILQSIVINIAARLFSGGSFFKGGNYVYTEHEQQQLLIYASNAVFPKNNDGTQSDPAGNAKSDKTLSRLRGLGWKTIPIDTENIKLKGDETTDSRLQDLDFLMSSPFVGHDGKLYCLAAESFAPSISPLIPEVTVLSIPDEEALLGGCNIADLDHGKVLIIQNRAQAPTAYNFITQYADTNLVHIIEAPENFLDSDGGPRCSITSLTFK